MKYIGLNLSRIIISIMKLGPAMPFP